MAIHGNTRCLRGPRGSSSLAQRDQRPHVVHTCVSSCLIKSRLKITADAAEALHLLKSFFYLSFGAWCVVWCSGHASGRRTEHVCGTQLEVVLCFLVFGFHNRQVAHVDVMTRYRHQISTFTWLFIAACVVPHDSELPRDQAVDILEGLPADNAIHTHLAHNPDVGVLRGEDGQVRDLIAGQHLAVLDPQEHLGLVGGQHVLNHVDQARLVEARDGLLA
mmetsp:Transcript_24820/g.41473  ORF Transcript_24820/g.41473 Transcript_24820/m.41473 type:complete len:219 (+) Transcript_24820:110-766(+)